jgi:hypothetical protein
VFVTDLAVAAAKSASAWAEPGILAFLVIFGMGVILYFVFRSMAKHLRKVNESARLEASQAEPPGDAGVPGQSGRDQGVQAGPGAR